MARGALAIDRFIFDHEGVQIRTSRVRKLRAYLLDKIRSSRVGKRRAYLLDKLVDKFPSLFVKDIPVANILVGGENGCFSAEFARLTGDLGRPSTPIARGPHIEFLRAYVDVGEEMFRPERFALTRYWANALRCIEVQGQYFGATTIDGVIEQARRFARMLYGKRVTTSDSYHTPDGMPVSVRRIKFSNCYEVVDGNHRLAISTFCGAEQYSCVVLPAEPLLTPMQQMVMESSWTEGGCCLRQPLDLPEFKSWPAVRGCADRLEMMRAFLTQRGVRPESYLDICCGYGWFVHQMSKQGCDAFGVDRNAAAVAIGMAVYGLNPSTVAIDDVGTFLSRKDRRYDVVSCFSILHHIALGKGSIPPVEFIRLVDAMTGTILFLDTGETHEGWFKNTLKEWTAEYIVDWLQKHTSFTSIQLLRTDQDNKGEYRGHYERQLFACVRS